MGTGPVPDWDARYAAHNAPFGGEPSAGVRAVFEMVRPRSALCLADGDGRNGTWLAAQGVDVTAVDLSPVATRLAMSRGRRAGVSVDRTVADVSDWTPGPGTRVDLAAVVFLQCETAVRLRAVRVAWECLNPGGLLLAEGFSASASVAGLIGPGDTDKLYDSGALRATADGGVVVIEDDADVILNEGPRHQGPARVLRLIIRKPD